MQTLMILNNSEDESMMTLKLYVACLDIGFRTIKESENFAKCQMITGGATTLFIFWHFGRVVISSFRKLLPSQLTVSGKLLLCLLSSPVPF